MLKNQKTKFNKYTTIFSVLLLVLMLLPSIFGFNLRISHTIANDAGGAII
ncbi:MAG: hypothetical protein FWF56_04325 [Firmicutes bacterium]|nr:hypothetical protein [Bacillota bacterium]MCL1953208.1 hypothetical protein [Bacillota bacterium]